MASFRRVDSAPSAPIDRLALGREGYIGAGVEASRGRGAGAVRPATLRGDLTAPFRPRAPAPTAQNHQATWATRSTALSQAPATRNSTTPACAPPGPRPTPQAPERAGQPRPSAAASRRTPQREVSGDARPRLGHPGHHLDAVAVNHLPASHASTFRNSRRACIIRPQSPHTTSVRPPPASWNFQPSRRTSRLLAPTRSWLQQSQVTASTDSGASPGVAGCGGPGTRCSHARCTPCGP
jgi:hypothetical protein